MVANMHKKKIKKKSLYLIMWAAPHFQLFNFNESLELCVFL